MSKQDRDDIRKEQRVARGDTSDAPEQDVARRARANARTMHEGVDRPRVLDGGPESDVFNAGLPEALVTRPSSPRIWLWLYREAAAADVTARLTGAQLSPTHDYRVVAEPPG